MSAPSAKQRAVTMKRNGMDDSLVGAVLGISADDVRSLVYDANPDVELPGGSTGDGGLLISVTDLSYDEMVTLPTTPVLLVETPDPEDELGINIVPLWAFLQMGEEGDFGGWSHATEDVSAYLQISTYPGIPQFTPAVRRLARLTPRNSIDELFTAGETAFLGPYQYVKATANVDQQPVDGASVDDTRGSLYINAGNGGVDFEPLDEGGYPDAKLRVTVGYVLTERVS